ncbi:AF4/FMR2 family member 4-like isoform X2 [Coccinella septempunctata]|uniref:AF4/FMR2 family member 4-like isoform X2 n=1 Tax=Coccinella septempunctata TaxID=41139 RepID=UPI001D0860A5|nr:AF4/FMR2 family member 4-like isoform X2 [Coccinella septempunctata]
MQGKPGCQPVVIPPLFGNPVKVPSTNDDPLTGKLNRILGDYGKVKHLYQGKKIFIAPGIYRVYAAQRRAHNVSNHQLANRRPYVATTQPNNHHYPGFPFIPDRIDERGPRQNHQVRQGNINCATHKQNDNGLVRQMLCRSVSMGRPLNNTTSRLAAPIVDPMNLPPQNSVPGNVELDRALAEMLSEMPLAKDSSTRNRNVEPLEQTAHNVSGTSADLRMRLALSDISEDEDEDHPIVKRTLSPIAAKASTNCIAVDDKKEEKDQETKNKGRKMKKVEMKSKEENLMIDDGSDYEKYFVEAKKLKHLADSVSDPFKHCQLYMYAVLHFLLTGDAMEKKGNKEEAAFTMFRDTLSLNKYISGRYKQHMYSRMFTTLAVLNYRCQSRVYFKLLEIKRKENREYEKKISDFYNKIGAEPTASSTVSPSGSVGSIENHYSSGKSGSDPPTRKQGIWVPLPVRNAASIQNQHLTYLLGYMDLWEAANSLVENAGLTEFFIHLDRTCRPLLINSSIRHLVWYCKKGIELAKEKM